MQKQYLECGKIVGTHGLLGELKVQPWCDDPAELTELRRLYFDRGQTPISIKGARVHKGMALLQLTGVDTVEAAAALRGRVVYLDRADLTLAEGEYFIQDLIGLAVLDADSGERYGTLSDVTQTGANDVYHITFADGAVRLIPVIDEVVVKTDLAAGTLHIRPLKGLFDDED